MNDGPLVAGWSDPDDWACLNYDWPPLGWLKRLAQAYDVTQLSLKC